MSSSNSASALQIKDREAKSAGAARTLTRADLTDAVYRRVGLSRSESAALVESVLDEICDALVRGETVKLSSFGSFVVRKKGQRIGRNPNRPETDVPIPQRAVVKFKPGKEMREAVLKLSPDQIQASAPETEEDSESPQAK